MKLFEKMTLKQMVWRVLRAILLGYILAGVALYVFQRDILYHPKEKVKHSYPVERLVRDGVGLEVIVLHPGKTKAILYFGGNAEPVGETAMDVDSSLSEYTIYFVNYRGFGGSDGLPTEQDLYADALFMYDKFQPKHTQLVVLGRSLGSGVASYVAVQRPVQQLILATPYDSVESVAQARYPIYPIAWMIHDRFDSLSRASTIRANTLVLLAESDQVVPHAHSQRLIHALSRVQVQTISGSEHHDIVNSERFYKAVEHFLQHG